MERYQNRNGNSNIAQYQIEPDKVIVQFKTGSIYSYSYQSAGVDHIEQMKTLAQRGYGLNSYIMRYVRKLYD